MTLKGTGEIKSHPIFKQLPLDGIQQGQALDQIKERKKTQQTKKTHSHKV